jgi:uncharacterized coiled-coil DUF342 family protein
LAARCAGCLQPIGDADKFVLANTEVFHRSCAGLVERSRSTKLALTNIELRRQVEVLRAEVAEVRRLRAAIDDANRDARAVRAERDTLERNLHRYANRNRELEAMNDELVHETQTIRRESERIRARLDALSAEVAGLAAASSGSSDSGAKTNDDLDDAAQRFRLLELDPLE